MPKIALLPGEGTGTEVTEAAAALRTPLLLFAKITSRITVNKK